jgi:hypothetical protein
MTAITVGSAAVTVPAKVSAAKVSATKASAAKPGVLARAWALFLEARMRQAERELALYRHLLPGELQSVGERLAPRSEKDLPFVR